MRFSKGFTIDFIFNSNCLLIEYTFLNIMGCVFNILYYCGFQN